MLKNKTAVFFDMDHTVINTDSMISFFFFYAKRHKVRASFFLFLLKTIFSKNFYFYFITKKMSDTEFKNHLFSFFKFNNIVELNIDLHFFMHFKIIKNIDKNFLNFCLNNKDCDIYICTASSSFFAKQFALMLNQKYKIDIKEAVGSKSIFSDRTIIFVENFKGELKKNYVEYVLISNNYLKSFAFGDSKYDLMMMEPCTSGYVGVKPCSKIKQIMDKTC